MNGYEKRRLQIIDRIEKSALELFTNDKTGRVSMDEIAARANVSKVTIYKYFHSKEELRKEVIFLYANETLSEIEKILDSDLDFISKLKIAIMAQVNSPKVADYQALADLLGADHQGTLVKRINAIMYRYYEDGKKEGFINQSQSFEMLSLYSGVFQAGFMAMANELNGVLADPQAREQLLELFFFGMIRRK